MKVVIMAGGVGSRLSEETEVKPKPMVEIGGKPILWHIMKHYSHFGHNEFFIALGYKGEVIKRYFLDCAELEGNLDIDIKSGTVRHHDTNSNNWKVHLIDTGIESLTGTRLRKLAPFLKGERFMMTWGDQVADVNFDKLVAFHKSHGKLATMTVVRPPSRFGHPVIKGDQVIEFLEKPQAREGWINGVYLVLEPEAIDYINPHKNVQWDYEPMQKLAKDGQLMVFKHTGFWQCMDTLREKVLLDQLWSSGNPPWKIWK